jgi:uncharacterized protein YraI
MTLPGTMRVILGAGLLFGLCGGALAKPAYVTSTVNLRASAGTDSEIVAKIPGGSLVDADNCTDGWCAVTWQDKTGFAIQRALDLSGRVPQRVVRGPSYGRVYVDEPPVYYAPPPPPPYYVRPYYGRYYYGRPWRWHHW